MADIYPIFLLLMLRLLPADAKGPDLSDRVVHAINCGGRRHQGAYGIVYQEERNIQGIASDFGTRWAFPNAPEEDRKLYETERYHDRDMFYIFDIPKEGNYVIILKFSEVYFQGPGQKIFHVNINDIPVKRNLDIFQEAGATGAAYDIYVDVFAQKSELIIGDMIAEFDGKLTIKLTPVVDNPKINAIAILTGRSDTLPAPPPPVTFEDASRRRRRKPVEDEYEEMEYVEQPQRAWEEPVREFASGPRTRDPFEDKNDNVFVYLGVTLVCLLPVVAFLMHM